MAPTTRGERVIAFIKRHAVVPEGVLVGQPVRLADFQRKFLLDICDNPHGTDMAILSVSRKNAKSALIAFIMVAHLVAPELYRIRGLYPAL
jgi:phage terminase large subunit-like protein